ncbi:recombination regulator RecX [Legionella nautarum]|uniref:Recombination regulator RecX n=1 Tax=Legionella nautarum TaxID=45070 RepID=A0A0W0WWB0_9GAMM|nr:regulatory protein RecX [Legionella nautarum]KTD36586.1 recombination regulator RecX [Legionella nautarum]
MSSIIDVAIKRLSDSSCSEHELRLFLENEFSTLPNRESRIDATFKRLKELQLINDLRLAMNLAQHYAHKGNRFISQMLEQKGISEEIITRVLLSLENENVRALDEARKKLGGKWDSSENATTLLHRFLSGRSFSYAAIKTVIGQLEQSAA